ncbi:DUF4179 domain-containing protein [Neobacillus sp. SCS-31]|uniref:DUF4179 domain-containing protein n=1 Tax=Neobacillus oceani TaxID=3115292 RepID=UPI003905FF88
MSVFKDLNNVKMDLSEFEEIPLSQMEQKRILKKIRKKSSLKNQKKKWIQVSIAAMAIFVLSFSLLAEKGTIASMPFVGGIIEKYIYPDNENLDFSSFKTAIGETAENHLGKLTLNEVMMDTRQVVLSATFEPAEGVEFDYQTTIQPKVKINGQDYSVTTGSQSIELNSSMFTIYNDIDLSQSIETEMVQLEITYDTWEHDTAIAQPWTFKVDVSQAELLKERKIYELNQTVKLSTGDKVTVQKVVTTPISTTIYYDLSQSKSEDIHFVIQSDEERSIHSTSYNSNEAGDVSYARFNGVTLQEAKEYFLVAFDIDKNQLINTPIPIK